MTVVGAGIALDIAHTVDEMIGSAVSHEELVTDIAESAHIAVSNGMEEMVADVEPIGIIGWDTDMAEKTKDDDLALS